jgi:hypothetical protein
LVWRNKRRIITGKGVVGNKIAVHKSGKHPLRSTAI